MIDEQRAVTFGTSKTARWLYNYAFGTTDFIKDIERQQLDPVEQEQLNKHRAAIRRRQARHISKHIHRINQRLTFLGRAMPECHKDYPEPARMADWRNIVQDSYNHLYSEIRMRYDEDSMVGNLLVAYLRERFRPFLSR